MLVDEPVQYLPGVGPKIAEKLKRLGIETVRDLLFYYPRRYDDFSHPSKISSLRIDQDAIIKAQIVEIKQSRTRRRWMSIIEATLADDSGEIKAIWFNQPFLLKILKPGNEWLFAGKVNWDFQSKNKTFTVTQYENPSNLATPILPVYPETAGITSKYIRKLVKPILVANTSNVSVELAEEYLPEEILNEKNLIRLNEALRKIHFPENLAEIEGAKKRLGFDELFLIALRMLLNKKELSKSNAVALTFDERILQSFVKKLPFKLTNAQRKAAWEIICDLGKTVPMNRLLEGDVGSGKTVVAAMAVLVASENKYQSVWLAPTEILANQHFQNVSKILKPFGIKVGLLTSAQKKANLEKDNLIIGTHALLQKDISLPRLALIIIDEQHRFGVKQRAHLRQSTDYRQPTAVTNSNNQSAVVPHLLSMTATPIPRTMALAIYGDLDISIIDEAPTGRKRVITRIVQPKERQKAYDFIRAEVKNDRQVFVVCPLIEEQKLKEGKLFDLDKKSAVKEFERLSTEIFPDLKIGLLHGKMKSKEKEKTMEDFSQGKLDVLVSTAVVEVGIDIPNATVMMIEGAERFGLAQLHQFRGRVGRGEFQSYCFLFSESNSENTRKRLGAMVRCYDGFLLAEEDLQNRGPGELAGIKQSGLPDLKMATLSDTILVKEARKAAEDIITIGLEKYQKLQEKLTEFESERHLE